MPVPSSLAHTRSFATTFAGLRVIIEIFFLSTIGCRIRAGTDPRRRSVKPGIVFFCQRPLKKQSLAVSSFLRSHVLIGSKQKISQFLPSRPCGGSGAADVNISAPAAILLRLTPRLVTASHNLLFPITRIIVSLYNISMPYRS